MTLILNGRLLKVVEINDSGCYLYDMIVFVFLMVQTGSDATLYDIFHY